MLLLNMIVLLVAVAVGAFSASLINGDYSSDVCNSQQETFEPIIKNEKALEVFYFVNDTKETIQLTWAGENSGVLILVTMTEGESGPGLTSDIYRSDNNGKTFTKITRELGENIYIRRENGLQRHQNQRDSKELFVICYDVENMSKSMIFVTEDGGSTWERSSVPFVLSGQLRFYPRERLSPWVLTLEEKTSILYLSLDNGKTWRSIHENVVDYFWSIYESDPGETIYILYQTPLSKNGSEKHVLAKSSDLGLTWSELLRDVIRVWAPRGIKVDIPKPHDKSIISFEPETVGDYETIKLGHFLYASHYSNSGNRTLQLSVSTDGGKTFNKAHLPTIQSERFYSVLEVEDDSAFVHVDAPNDTGYGALFISDITGTVFSESLRHHLYPNHAPVTDFYRVASMRGTYLATRLNPDRTLYTVITHDRGASWHALGTPLNVQDTCQTKPTTTLMTTTATTTMKSSDTGNVDSSMTSVRMKNNRIIGTQSDGNSVANGEDVANKGNLANADNNLLNPSLNLLKDASVTKETNTTPNEIWRPDPNMGDSVVTDPSSVKTCGLQISNQFSIKNRVIASPPLSIAAAPGLILAHGHVATHLKNTPADVFVSSDGGYTWLKALDGPHHYQIANRGGLIVAVPAETLWPDVLRFSTDEGRCWHTIPLRTGQWGISESSRYHINSDNDDSIKGKIQNHNDDSVDDDDDTGDKIKVANVEVTDLPSSEAHQILLDNNTTSSKMEFLTKTTSSNDPAYSIPTTINNNKNITTPSSTKPVTNRNQLYENHNQQNDDDDKWSTSTQKTDEIVVFTGLVTEPGGRAMAAAVYGYGTATQRWRVAVVDFRSNGMITRKCTDDDYEIWIPHSNEKGEKDGCLLGVREQFRRLKKDSLCANEYGVETRIQVEFCPCTQADYECEYGFYRQPGSLNCIRNPYIPPLDPCTLPKKQRQTIHHLGYRRIPGDRCVGGWQPPIWNQTILGLLRACPHEVDDESSSHNSAASIISVVLILFGLILLLVLWIRSNRRSAQIVRHSNYRFTTSVSQMKTTTTNTLRRWFVPIIIPRKRYNFGGICSGNDDTDGGSHRLTSGYGDSQTILWPPLSSSSMINPINCNDDNEQNVNMNSYATTKCIQPKYFNKQQKNKQNNTNHMNVDNKTVLTKKSINSTLMPTLKGGIYQHCYRHNNSDVTNLLEAEEIPASVSSVNDLNTESGINESNQSFTDPLASFTHKSHSKNLSNGLVNMYNNYNGDIVAADNSNTELNHTDIPDNTVSPTSSQ